MEILAIIVFSLLVMYYLYGTYISAAAMFNKISKSVEKDSDIKWNFTKFLISRDGTKIERFAPTTEPKDIESAIEAML